MYVYLIGMYISSILFNVGIDGIIQLDSVVERIAEEKNI